MSRSYPILAVIFFLFYTYTYGQDNSAPETTLRSPYNTMYVHLYYLQDDSYEPARAAAVFQPGKDSSQAIRRAKQLKQIYDGKGLYVRLNQLPRQPDYVDTSTEKAIYTPFPNELPDIYLEQVDGKWYYSDDAYNRIPTIHAEVYPFGADALLKLIPRGGQRSVLGLKLWQWAGLLLIILASWLLHLLLSRLFRPIVRRISRSKYSQPLEDKSFIWKIARNLSLLLIAWLIKLFLPALQLPIKTAEFLTIGVRIAIAVFFIILVFRIIDIVILYASRYAEFTESKLDDQLLPILKRMAQGVLIIGGIFHILNLVDVNVTALIAGISIGGLALALAAQDTVKNLIGSALIFVDQPFQIGDWVEDGNTAGTVVEVGFRSTRIQLPDSSIVSVPNGNIVAGTITNRGVRTFRLFEATLGVTYDTPSHLLNLFVQGLREMVRAHPETDSENFYVNFHSFGDSSLNIFFRAAMFANTYADDLRIREELAFGILDMANAIGIRFAFPSSSLYIENFPEKQSLVPSYDTPGTELDERLREFLEAYRKKVGEKTGDQVSG